MLQTEAAIEEVKPLSPHKILELAQSVDMVTNEAFIELSRSAKIPSPREHMQPDFGVSKGGQSYRHRIYSDLFAAQLPLVFDEPVDGRVVAVRFLDHLVDNGMPYRIARPREFSILGLISAQRDLLLNPQDDLMRERLEKLRQEVGYLLNYAMGRVEITDQSGVLRYYVSGVLPLTHSVLITVPIGSNHGSQAQLYRGFLERLSK